MCCLLRASCTCSALDLETALFLEQFFYSSLYKEFANLFSQHQYWSCFCLSISDLLNIVNLGRIQLLEITILSILKWPTVRLQIWGLLELQLNLHDAASILKALISVCKHLCFDKWQSIVNDPESSFYFSAFTARERTDFTHTVCDFFSF